MPTKTLSLISTVLTAILVFLIGLVMFFGTIVMLNGFSGREGTAAIMISLVCQGGGLILSAILAGRLTRLFIEKFNWNNILAVILSVAAGTLLGGVFAFGSLFISLIAAEISWNSRF